MKEKKVYCSRCKFGTINKWGNKECWLFDKTAYDDIVSVAAAVRERHAEVFNRNNNCKHYVRESILIRLLRCLFRR